MDSLHETRPSHTTYGRPPAAANGKPLTARSSAATSPGTTAPAQATTTPDNETTVPAGAMYLGSSPLLTEASDELPYSGHEGLIYTAKATLNGAAFEHGIAIRAGCVRDTGENDKWLDYPLGGSYSKFQAIAGVTDASAERGIRELSFAIYLDGFEAYSSAVSPQEPVRISLPVAGVSIMRLLVKPSDQVRCTSSGYSGDARRYFGGGVLVP